LVLYLLYLLKTLIFIAYKCQYVNLIYYLTEDEVDKNKANENGTTPIFDFCKNGNERIIRNLIEHEEDINKVNKGGKTLIYIHLKLDIII